VTDTETTNNVPQHTHDWFLVTEHGRRYQQCRVPGCSATLYPVTNPPHLPDASAASSLLRLRYWLISKLAGNRVVILNACFDVAEFNGTYFHKHGETGALIANSAFPATHTLHITPRQESELPDLVRISALPD
jgi:hypothetical protein